MDVCTSRGMPPNARIHYQGCPLCNALASALVMVGDCSRHSLYKHSLPKAMRWLKCGGCGHLYVEGYFTQAALEMIFSGTHASQVPGYDIENQRSICSKMVDSVNAQRQALGGRWLDVGFGNGSLMTTAAEYGYQVVGLDLREESVRLMREFGYEAHTVPFEEFRGKNSFDVISMADVLEHMPFPRSALFHARDLLNHEGVLFLSMPNVETFLFRALTTKECNPYWGELEHYHNFGRKRLYTLLEECGFRPVYYGVSSRYRSCMEVIAKKWPPCPEHR